MKDEILNKLISVAYDDSTFFNKIKVYFIIWKNKEAYKIFNEYKRTATELKKMSIDECPVNIIETISKVSNANQKQERSLFSDLYTFYLRRPIASAAAVTVIVFALVTAILFNRPEIKQTYTKQELELANEQVKQSLAIIGHVFNKTQETIEKEILANRVGKPIRKGIKVVNDILIEGEKNEKPN